MSIKLDQWIHADSRPGDLALIPRGQACMWDADAAGEALIVSLPSALSVKAAAQETSRAPDQVAFMPQLGRADPLVHAIGQAILGELQTQGLLGMLLKRQPVCRPITMFSSAAWSRRGRC